MNILPIFSSQDLSRVVKFDDVFFQVESFDWSVEGGPRTARISASGEPWALFVFLNHLRDGVVLRDELGQSVWWGFAAAATIRTGGIEFGLSLDSMRNHVAVAYSEIAPGEESAGTRQTTGWASNAQSIALYGQRDLLGTASSGTADSAEAYRDAKLDELKWPVPQLKQSPGGAAGMTVECRGWLDMLDWIYYARNAGAEAYEAIGTGTQAIGDATAQTKVAQSFQLGTAAGWDALTVKVRMRKQNSPADTVYLDLCPNSAGAPGTALATASLSGAGLNGSTYQWVTFTFSAPVALALATTYWIVVRRSGAMDGTNYYMVDGNESLGYTRGVFRIWNGSAWVARSTDADMLFKVGGVKETTQQIVTLVTGAGQMLAGTTIENASGLYTCEYRDGDKSALVELRELLRAGTLGGARLLAEVGEDRMVRVYVEPTRTTSVEVMLDASGRLFNAKSELLAASEQPTGKWCALKDVLPPTLDVSRMAEPGLFFIEEAEYNARERRWTATKTRGAGSVFEEMEVG
jgi:hypothetical protein